MIEFRNDSTLLNATMCLTSTSASTIMGLRFLTMIREVLCKITISASYRLFKQCHPISTVIYSATISYIIYILPLKN